METISRKQSKSTFASLKLAQRIAKDRGISTKEAVELLSSNAEDNQEFFYDYAPEIEELQSNTVGAVEQQIAYVTLFMQYRGEVKLPRSRDWQKLSDWTESDTEAMPAKYMEEIFRLIGWERDGWPEPEGKSEVVEVTVTNLPPTNS